MRAAFFAVAASCAFIGCAPHSSGFAQVENHLRSGNSQAALKTLESKPPPDRDMVVFELNRAMILQDLGRYEDSAESFETAKKLFTEYDAISVSEQGASLLINDGAIAYKGADFERVLTSFYAAINYLLKGDLYGARVEIMQGDERLKAIDSGAYEDDAALRYLSGAVFEALGENGDALVSYRQAYRVYKEGYFGVGVPDYLKNDLLRLSKRLSVTQEHEQYKSEFGLSGDFGAIGANQGELIVILSGGFAPIKRADEIMVSSSVGLIGVSLPHYETRPFAAPPWFLIDDTQTSFDLIENVSAIALETLKNDMPAITARAIARIVAKKGAEVAAAAVAGGGKNDGAAAVAGLIMSIFNLATEVADTRGWYILPDRVYIARARLDQGFHRVTIGTKAYNIEIKAGERLFLAPRLY
ncbi:MAG: hypothetical protein LBO72_03165 [Helicobacteraceae bacterium]|jgi:hypothetical protein|nr:hypothetical protein [Helicobacteraceae bacterium]